MRAAIISCFFCLVSAGAGAQLPSIDTLAAMPSAERPAALLRIRHSDDSTALLNELQMAAQRRVDARRERRIPPLSAGCLEPDEFDLDTQLNIARRSK